MQGKSLALHLTGVFGVEFNDVSQIPPRSEITSDNKTSNKKPVVLKLVQ